MTTPMDKTFDPATAEPRIAAAWHDAGAFRAGAGAAPGAPAFCVMIPPPNVTGSLHIGHALNNTLQDILVRWHRMRGFDVLWQPGQDHAGIATQMVVERQMAERQEPDRRTIGREAFTEKVWAWKEESGGTIIGQLRRLGASCDWSRNRFTMDPGFHDAVIRVFVDLYRDGIIYRGKRLVNWDPRFETAISDLEVENREVPGHMWHFKYPLAGGETYEYIERDADGRVTLRETRDYIAIATTRPETMLGDGAVAVHLSDERYAPIVGKLCAIPVGPKEHRRLIPIITDDYPDPAFGSGAVKITGAHDFNDYAVAQRNRIPLYRLMDGRARLRSDGLSYADSAAIATRAARGEDVGDVSSVNLVPEALRGLDRLDARRAVVEQITDEGLAVTILHREIDAETGAEHLERRPLVESKPIMQPHGDRSGVVIEPMLTDQWFVDTARIVQPAIDAVRDGRTRIIPDQHRKVYLNWLEAIEPWTISRQLWWGHRIPVWYDTEGNQYCAASRPEIEAMVKARHGDDVIVRFRDEPLFGDPGQRDIPAPTSAASGWVDPATDQLVGAHRRVTVAQDPDVLDTWFSSGLWPLGTLGWPEATDELARYYPTSTLITGFDIIFFWVARMMMMQLHLTGDVPFRDVYVHGLVRDEKGAKMSKSKGNVIDPLTLIDAYGADALRFTLTGMAAMGRDPKLGPKHVEANRNFVTKLWNATRFAQMNGAVHGGPRPEPRHTVNRWILGEVARITAATDAALDGYRFNDAAAGLYAFVWGTVCDWYVEFAKPLFDGPDADETRATMGHVLDRCYALLHPVMPFVTEELWALTGARPALLALSPWPDDAAADPDPAADRQMRWVIGLIESVRSARAQMGVPAGAVLDLVVTQADAEARAALAANAPLVMRLARVNAPADGTAGRGSLTVAAPGASFALPVGDVIDVAAETARLQKAAQKADRDAAGLGARLSNPKFALNADPEVIADTQEKLAALREDQARLAAALATLEAMA